MVKRYSTDNTPPEMKLYGEQFAYGHREVLLQYCGFTEDLIFKAHVPHGKISPNFLDPIQEILDEEGNSVLQLLWRSDSKSEAAQFGIHNVEPIGATFLYLLSNIGQTKDRIQNTLWHSATNFDWPASTKYQKEYLMKYGSILYMPMHSWDGDVRRHFAPSQSPLLSIPPERITVLLGFLDFCDPKTRAVYASLGWRVTCAGARSSKVTGSPAGGRAEFLANLYDIFLESQVVVSDEFTTGLLYAMTMGRKVGVLSQTEKLELTYSSWQSQTSFDERILKFREHYNWLNGSNSNPQNVYLEVSKAVGIETFKEPGFFLDNVEMIKFGTKYAQS